MVTSHALPLAIRAKNGPWPVLCTRIDVAIETGMFVLPLIKWKLCFMAVLTTVCICGIRVMSDHWSQRLVCRLKIYVDASVSGRQVITLDAVQMG